MSRHAIRQLTARKGPMTIKQLAIELRLTDSTVRTTVRRARAGGSTEHLRIAGWSQNVPMYGPGPGPDVDGGGTEQRILDWLEGGERATARQLAEHLGITNAAAEAAIRRLRKKRGKLRIVGWNLKRGKGGRESPIYSRGPGPDEPRPDFSDAALEYYRRYNEKRRIKRGHSVRRSRGVTASPVVASPFDGLMR